MSSDTLPAPSVVPLCKIQVRKGFSLINLFTFFYASMVNIIALAFINAALPFLLSNFLHLKSEEGTVTGTVLMWNEIVVILSCSLWGLCSDYLGRKPIYVIGFLLIGIRYTEPHLLSLSSPFSNYFNLTPYHDSCWILVLWCTHR